MSAPKPLPPLPPWIRKVIVDVHKFRPLAEDIPEHPTPGASRLRATRKLGSADAVVNVHDREGGAYRITTTFSGEIRREDPRILTADFGTEYELDQQLRMVLAAGDR